MRRIAIDGAVAYGHRVLVDAAEQGAIAEIYILSALLRDTDAHLGTHMLGQWVNEQREQGVKIIQCTSFDESGAELEGIGGIAALLHYPLR